MCRKSILPIFFGFKSMEFRVKVFGKIDLAKYSRESIPLNQGFTACFCNWWNICPFSSKWNAHTTTGNGIALHCIALYSWALCSIRSHLIHSRGKTAFNHYVCMHIFRTCHGHWPCKRNDSPFARRGLRCCVDNTKTTIFNWPFENTLSISIHLVWSKHVHCTSSTKHDYHLRYSK